MAQLKQVLKGPNEIVPFDHPFIHYPQLASTKFDGFRLLNLCGDHLLSPALKPFPNRHLGTHLENFLIYCGEHRIVTDGEVWSPNMPFNELSSVIRSHDKQIPSGVAYYIFDLMSEEEWDNGTEEPFIDRYKRYEQLLNYPNIVLVKQWLISNAAEAETFFTGQLEQGHEGMILRSPSALYKHGRCTLKQDGIWKFKEFQTHDAVIVGMEEQMRLKEGVERTRNEVGHLERRYEQNLYEPAGMVGAFWVEQDGLKFKVKPGKTHNNEWKQDVWFNRQEQIGRHCEYKWMPHGTKDKPRIGSLVRFRPDLD